MSGPTWGFIFDAVILLEEGKKVNSSTMAIRNPSTVRILRLTIIFVVFGRAVSGYFHVCNEGIM